MPAEDPQTSQRERERLEIDFWTNSPDEAPGAESLDAFTNKMSEARVVLEKFQQFESIFGSAGTILELGGGQCWISCMIKRQFAHAGVVVGSDIARDAVASYPEWERVFRIEVTGGLACRSYEIPLRSGSVDLIVVFAGAHHFGAHRRTLSEIARVLGSNGRALYLHEPGCRAYIHRIARWRVMAKRPAVAEDVLVYRRLADLAREAGLATEVVFSPTTTYRGPLQTMYYFVLGKLRFLQRYFPCSIDLVFTKPPRG